MTYMPTEKFKKLAAAPAAIEPCAFAGKLAADQVKVVLGECADIWPASILQPKPLAMKAGPESDSLELSLDASDYDNMTLEQKAKSDRLSALLDVALDSIR